MSFKSTVPTIALVVATVALAGCHGERKAKADTGTAEATVKTKAPASEVSSSDLQQQAQAAATAASTPVDGSKMNTMTAAPASTSNTAH